MYSDVSNNDLCGTIPTAGSFSKFTEERYWILGPVCIYQLLRITLINPPAFVCSFVNNPRLEGPELMGFVRYDVGDCNWSIGPNFFFLVFLVLLIYLKKNRSTNIWGWRFSLHIFLLCILIFFNLCSKKKKISSQIMVNKTLHVNVSNEILGYELSIFEKLIILILFVHISFLVHVSA